MATQTESEPLIPPEEIEVLLITPLGAGQEVGRSCIMLEFKGKKIMLDCGIHPGLSGIEALPFVDNIETDEIDLLLVSHFHLDHCGALPWFLSKTAFKGRCFMTHATKEIYRYLLADNLKLSHIGAEQMLYTEADLEASMEKIETINFHEEKEVNGVRFWCYIAGHVLGAAMFMIEIAGVTVLYTGDFSRQEDRHLMAAEIPDIQPHVLIMESTSGVHIHENRDNREARFTGLVHDIVNRGGRCLIPVFALGRAQELLLILDEYWSNHPELHDIPIYYASPLAKKCMAVYQTYINAMNDRIKRQIVINNPFVFKHISHLKCIDHFDDIGPCVVMATPGMMQSGLSRKLFESWCTDSKNGVIITGYCVEGTLAKHILSEPEEIATMSGQKLHLKISVDYISFSAHTDYQQTSEFIRILKPLHIVLVHGEQNEMARLKAAIIREYEDSPDTHIEVYNPKNAQGVEIYFFKEETAKVMGALAMTSPEAGSSLSGVLVKKNFSHHLLAPSDIPKYINTLLSPVKQSLSVPYSGSLQELHLLLNGVTDDVKFIQDFEKFGEKLTLLVFDVITIFQESEVVVLEWSSSPTNDMHADAVIAIILQAGKSDFASKILPTWYPFNKLHFTECLVESLTDMFGEDAVRKIVLEEKLTVTVNGMCAVVNVQSLEVKCEEDPILRRMVSNVVMRLLQCLAPPQIVSGYMNLFVD